ncbi:MAG: hypothetical protein DYG89_34405 [Caldilinea sp. CFX5]|nr:hypothetical protein [Caldilinea sp. CFX5]
MQAQRGFQQWLLLLDAANYKTLSVPLWESAEAMAASDQASPYFQAQMQKIANLIVPPPVIEPYTVNLQVGHSTAAAYASVSSGQLQPGRVEQFVETWRARVAPHLADLVGFQAAYVLTDANTHKAMTLSLYTTAADAEAVQTSGKFRELVGMLADTLIVETVVRAGYEVAIQG